MCFTVAHDSPSLMEVLKDVPKVRDSNALCVAPSHVHDCRAEDRFLSADVEGVGGIVERDLTLLCPLHLSVGGLATLRGGIFPLSCTTHVGSQPPLTCANACRASPSSLPRRLRTKTRAGA